MRNCGPYQNGSKGVVVLDTSTEKLEKLKQMQVLIIYLQAVDKNSFDY